LSCKKLELYFELEYVLDNYKTGLRKRLPHNIGTNLAYLGWDDANQFRAGLEKT